MKCNSCRHLWTYPRDYTSPYGEYACMKTETDLYGTQPEDVENCEYYEVKDGKDGEQG